MVDIVERLSKIADASRRADGTDIPLGEEVRAGAAEILRLRAEVERLTTERDEWIEAAVKQQKAAKWARAEERERAAQIADKHAAEIAPKITRHRSDFDIGLFESAMYEALSIAAAIRASKDAGGGT